MELCKQHVSAVFDVDNTPSRTLHFSFSEFMQQPHCEELKDQLLYQRYYSRPIIDQGVNDFYLPDLQPLPSVVSNINTPTTKKK
jgi:hypothetical protein